MATSASNPVDQFVNQESAGLGGWDADPTKWGPIYQQASQQFNVPVPLLQALVHTESSGMAVSDSPAGAEGFDSVDASDCTESGR